MIEALTKEQELKLCVYKDKWIKIGLSVEDTDRPRAERGARLTYELAGYKPPSRILWVRSLKEGACAVAAMILQSDPNLTMDEITKYVSENKDKSQFKVTVNEAIQSALYGQHDAHWLAYYDYFQSVCGLEAPKKLEGLKEVAESACWWWAYDEVIVLSERGISLSRDDQHRLHNDIGPAYLFRDGFALYYIHGIRVPMNVIETPDSITVEQIESEDNVEVRRVMIEKMGLDKYVKNATFSVVSDDSYGTLLRRTMNGEDLQVVLVKNASPEPDGTYKNYTLMVPPDVTTAHEGVAWTFGMTTEEYHPVKET